MTKFGQVLMIAGFLTGIGAVFMDAPGGVFLAASISIAVGYGFSKDKGL